VGLKTRNALTPSSGSSGNELSSALFPAHPQRVTLDDGAICA
jgi:hypothetical protein